MGAQKNLIIYPMFGYESRTKVFAYQLNLHPSFMLIVIKSVECIESYANSIINQMISDNFPLHDTN